MAVAPQITQATDDVGPVTGTVYYGDYTNDSTPLLRVALGDQAAAGQTLRVTDNGQATGSSITLTAQQVSQGYAEIPVATLAPGWNLLAASLAAADGSSVATSSDFALGLSTTTPVAPVIVSADDNVGASTGTLHDGARTDDATPTFRISEAGLPDPPTGSPGHAPYGGPPLLSGHVLLYENGQAIGDAVIGYGGEVTITPGALTTGDHVFTAVAVDRAGNTSAASAPFHVTIAADGPPPSAAPSNGDDLLHAGPGKELLAGAQGADTLVGDDASDSLWGGQGDDSITGGAGASQLNGNQGEDTLIGHSRIGDELYGGQGNDLIDARAASGHDSINGNLGDDVIYGGSGGDMLWGGQGDDVITGGAGADWISGDKGNNTVTGGAGADIFYLPANSHTVVTDFSLAEGDRVQVDAGVAYTVSQGADGAVVDIAHGGELVLAGVKAADLTGGWIFHA
jgi:Ca2+-binding RTX toxin-like protein